jgi:hypothetical protein
VEAVEKVTGSTSFATIELCVIRLITSCEGLRVAVLKGSKPVISTRFIYASLSSPSALRKLQPNFGFP